MIKFIQKSKKLFEKEQEVWSFITSRYWSITPESFLKESKTENKK